jgi:ATP-dependent helicase Lhr and Lhr-like helicase
LVHQLLALTLAYGGVSAERCWELLHQVPDFTGITEGEYQALIEHMKQADYLFESGGLLSMGTKAERIFGKKNFFELYAVFSSPVLYRVLDESSRDLGSLEQNFVDSLVEQMTSFLLGGRPWVVLSLNHADRIVRVKAAPRGKKPSWGGFIPQFLGFEICQRIRQVLVEDTRYPYADELAMNAIQEWRDDLGSLLRGSALEVQISHDGARWWTFAGGRINQTLKYALEWLAGWKVTSDNFGVRMAGNGVSQAALDANLLQLRQPGFWQSERTSRELSSRVPEYRLSKFQGALPDHLQTEMIGSYLLDFGGAETFLLKGTAA